MADPLRIITSPIRLTGQLHLAHLSMLASADTLARRARAEGRDVTLEAPSLVGDLGGQTLVEREVARQGESRWDLGRDVFVERVRAYEADARERVAAQLLEIGIDVDLEAGAVDTEAAVVAARTAFVRLYEAGLLTLEERVVGNCSRCETVVDTADAVGSELDTEALTLRVATSAGDALEIDVIAPELLPGAVAVAVPDDHPAAGSHVDLPLGSGPVPVVADAGCTSAEVVVPAHDGIAFDLARRIGLMPVEVLDREGTVVAAGPLDGLARYAARAAAAAVLEGSGLIVARKSVAEHAARCGRCGTVLVPRLGRHWFLAMEDLEVGAADAAREGLITFAPLAARDQFLDRAGRGGDWCLSHQVWAGLPVPVGRCLDCGQVDVSVEPDTSCGKCMGTVVAEDDVLDARFVGALWPLASAGWPGDETGPETLAPETTLLVGPSGVVKWALPMAALGLWLAGAVPFCCVAVNYVETAPDDPDPRLPLDLTAVVEAEGARVVRAALVAGGLDLDPARQFVAAVDDPPEGDADVDALTDAYATAFASGTPGIAVHLIGAALDGGVRAEVADRVRALAAPILGD